MLDIKHEANQPTAQHRLSSTSLDVQFVSLLFSLFSFVNKDEVQMRYRSYPSLLDFSGLSYGRLTTRTLIRSVHALNSKFAASMATSRQNLFFSKESGRFLAETLLQYCSCRVKSSSSSAPTALKSPHLKSRSPRRLGISRNVVRCPAAVEPVSAD